MQRNQEDIKLESLERQLCCLGEVEVPEGLKAKLFAEIPGGKAGSVRRHRAMWRPGIWGAGIAAAAILVLGLLFMPSYGPSARSKTLIADLNDRTTRYVRADQNNALVEDSNYTGLSGQQ